MVAFFGFGVLAPYCQFAFIILNGGQVNIVMGYVLFKLGYPLSYFFITYLDCIILGEFSTKKLTFFRTPTKF